jgi:hypothetical protein
MQRERSEDALGLAFGEETISSQSTGTTVVMYTATRAHCRVVVFAAECDGVNGSSMSYGNK